MNAGALSSILAAKKKAVESLDSPPQVVPSWDLNNTIFQGPEFEHGKTQCLLVEEKDLDQSKACISIYDRYIYLYIIPHLQGVMFLLMYIYTVFFQWGWPPDISSLLVGRLPSSTHPPIALLLRPQTSTFPSGSWPISPGRWDCSVGWFQEGPSLMIWHDLWIWYGFIERYGFI